MPKDRNKRTSRARRRRRQQAHSSKPQYGLRITEQGLDTVGEINAYFRDRPMYYVLNERGEPTPLGRGHLLTPEERARWQTFFDDETEARSLEETVIQNPDYPDHPVYVHTAFMARDLSFAYPLPNGVPALWQTSLLEASLAERRRAALEADEEEDFSWLLEDDPDAPPEVVALASRLGLSIDEFDEWVRVYSTREEAVQGHAETVRWVRRSLGVF